MEGFREPTPEETQDTRTSVLGLHPCPPAGHQEHRDSSGRGLGCCRGETSEHRGSGHAGAAGRWQRALVESHCGPPSIPPRAPQPLQGFDMTSTRRAHGRFTLLARSHRLAPEADRRTQTAAVTEEIMQVGARRPEKRRPQAVVTWSQGEGQRRGDPDTELHAHRPTSASKRPTNVHCVPGTERGVRRGHGL